MKILVCTDGSEQSLKAINEAAAIAGGCKVDEISVIHVFESKMPFPYWGEDYRVTQDDLERFERQVQKEKEKRKEILSQAVNIFKDKGLEVKAFFKEGHPAETIAEVAAEEGFDMIVIGSRGLGGLKKLFLGSVSNAIVHQVKASVLVVK